jgi:hypothetical protein
MSKSKEVQKQSKWGKAAKTGIAATGFVTAVLVVLVICYMFGIEIQFLAVALAIVLVIVVGLPLLIHALRENNDIKDENETCQPIMRKYWSRHSTKDLIADYEEWTKGEHSSYSRVHFGGDVVAELQEAKEYEEALRILDELGNIDMKARERYDYDNYREKVRPQLLEGIETEKKRAEERARNKNLRKK